MAKIYRKSLLEKMQSPDKLDKMVKITPPSFWIAVIGGIVIIVIALIWSLVGTIPEKVDANGVFLYDQNSYVVSSEVSGIVNDVNIKVGDEVKKGDFLYSFDSESLNNELKSLKERLEKVEKITLTSKNDEASQDTQNLLSYKAQYIASKNNSSNAAYKVALEKYEDAKAEADEAKTKAEKAYASYQGYLAKVDPTVDIAYETQLTTQTNIIKALEAELVYYANCDTLYVASEEVFDIKKIEAKNSHDTATLAASATGRTIKDYHTNYQRGESIPEGFSDDKTSATTLLNNAKKDYQTIQYTMVNDPKYSENANIQSSKSNYDSAVNDYQTKAQIAASAEQSLASYEINDASGESSAVSQAKAYSTQFTAAKGALVDQLENEIEKYEKQIEMNTVNAKCDGIITNITIDRGSAVSQGSTTLVIRRKNDEKQVVLYVPITSGKRIEEGMEVKVSPTTVNRSEYGHMRGVVSSVAEYTTTDQEIFNKIGDQALASMFTANGPVVEVVCELERDDTSINGFAWSNDKGKTVNLKESTIVTAEIIVDEQHPISILVPFLKDKLENITKENDK